MKQKMTMKLNASNKFQYIKQNKDNKLLQNN